MKKILFLMLMLLTMGVSGFAQSTLTVANGTETNQYVPVYGFYADSYLRCQTIYPSSMLTSTTDITGESILGVTYYLSSPADDSWGSANFVVKVKEVTDTALTAFVDMTTATTVYTGPLDGTQSTMEIDFTAPYTYQGGNLLIEITNTAEGDYLAAYFYGTTATGASWQGYSYTSVSDISGSAQDFIPKTTFMYGTPPTCFKVTNLAVDASQTTTNSLTLTWADALNTGATYNIYDMSDTTLIQGGITGLTYTITGLTGSTTYTFGVETDCGGGDIALGYATVTANTACAAITLPYTETFESTSGTISCWSTSGSGTWAIGTGDYSTSTGSFHGTQNALITHVSTGNVTKLISPVLDGVQNGMMLDFAYVMRAWSSDIDELRVYSRAAADSAWQLQATYTNAVPNWTAESITIPGTVYQVAFEHTDNYGYGIGIDDVRFADIPNCTKPANLAVTSSSSNSVGLSWTEVGTATAWNVVYGQAGFNPDTVTTNIEYVSTSPAVTISNLTSGTSYEFYVQSDCGGDVSDWRGPVTVTPGLYNMGTSGWDTLYTCGSVIYDNGGPTGTYPSNCSATLTIYPATPGATVMITGTASTESCCDYLQVFDGVTTSGTPLAEYKDDNQTVSCISTSGPLTLYFYSDGSIVRDGFALNVSCVSCLTPQLSVGMVGMDEVTVNWSDNSGGQATYEIVYGPAGFNPDTVTPEQAIGLTSYTMTNLATGTTYDVYLRMQCDDGTYAPWKTTTVTTLSSLAAPVPYTCDFEDATENAAWTLVNGSQTNKWYIGNAVHSSGDSALYISNNNGLNNEYDNTIASIVWAYRDIAFDNSPEFALSFDWRCNGESTFDYLEVYSGAPAPVTAGTETAPLNATLLGRFNQDTVWRHEMLLLNSQYSNTTQRLYFLWKNDGSQGDFPAAGLDNITVTGMICGSPYNLALDTTTSSSATVHFTPASIGDANWEMVVLAPNDTIDASQAIALSDTTYEITNLASGVPYRVFVRTDCGSGDYSGWVGPLTFVLGAYNMGTSGWDTLYTCGSVIYDNGGPTGVYDNSVDAYLVLYPDQPGSFVQVSGTLVAESSSWDYLIFYDGVGTANQILKTNQTSSSQTYQIPTITSSTGPLTIYFHTDGSGQYDGYEIITSCINCVSPSMAVTNLTTTEATLDWSNFAGSQTSFEIVYGAPGINPDNETPVTVSNVTSYTITGLTPATAYVAYIRSDCGDGTYSNWNQLSFNTECVLVSTFPYTENFDAVTGTLPACWTGTGSDTQWEVTSSFHGSVTSAHSGSSVLQFYQGGSGDQATLQLPTFDLTSLTNPTLSFWYTNEAWGSDQDQMTVYYRTSTTGSWIQLATYNSSVSTWTYDSLALPSPSATYQIKIDGISDYGYGINLDDISIFEGSGSGPAVTDPTVATNAASSIGQTNATLNGTITNPDGVTITAKGFEWKATTGGTYAPIAGTGTGNTFTADLTGLTPNTGYTFKAFITYNGTTVYGSEMTFTTQSSTVTPPTVTTNDATSITQTTATLNGAVTAGDETITAQGFEWKETAGGTYTVVNATGATMSYDLTGLTPNTSYTFKAFATTASGTTYGAEKTFTTEPVGINNYEMNNVVVYPNPTKGTMQIQNSESRIENVEVYDAYGKLLNVVNVNDNTAALDLSGYAAGTYFVKIMTENGMVTKRIVRL